MPAGMNSSSNEQEPWQGWPLPKICRCSILAQCMNSNPYSAAKVICPCFTSIFIYFSLSACHLNLYYALLPVITTLAGSPHVVVLVLPVEQAVGAFGQLRASLVLISCIVHLITQPKKAHSSLAQS
jgi:hypothetical protein